MFLKHFADILSGHTLRGRVEHEPDGDCHIVQLKDVDMATGRIKELPHLTFSVGLPSHQFLRKGDVLFIAKGGNNYALVFNEDYSAIATSVFFIIRPNPATVNPFYLSWFINQSSAQGYLHAGKEGTMVTNINKITLENLSVELPPINIQNKIAELNTLMQKEIYLTDLILKKRKLFIEKTSLSLIKNIAYEQ